jgi:uncharacterized protein (TIGR02145 family)
MKSLRYLCIIFMFSGILFLTVCKKESSDTSDKAKTIHVAGCVQKGPYINGGDITLNELNTQFAPEGKHFNTVTTDNKGSFELNNIEIASHYLELDAVGFYFNEITGEYSNARLTLNALVDSTNISTVNVNVLTHLEKSRIEYLVNHDLSFSAAKDSAQKEILAIFGFAQSGMEHSEKLDISVNSEENAILLAISIILQGNRPVTDLSEILQQISTDISEDGIVSDEEICARLYNSTLALNLATVRTNITNCYQDLDMNDSLPDFETYIEEYLITQKPFDIDDSITDVTCYGAKDGKIDITMNEGTAPFAFHWSNGASTEDVTGLARGNYSVTITDANNYILTKRNMQVTGPAEIIITATTLNATCESSDGSIDVAVTGGIPPYLYAWSNGTTTQNLTDIPGGNYTLTITDAHACSVTEEITVGKNTSNILISGTISDATCESNDGAIDITVSGGTPPYLYAWSNGATMQDLTDIPGGNYTLTVTDALECSVSHQFVVVKKMSDILITDIVTNTTGENNNGAIDITVTGGTQPYIYAWSNGASTEDLINLSEGRYAITVTDVNQCIASKEFFVYGSVADYEGNIYKTVTIGTEVWMAENLRTIHYNNGDLIPEVLDENIWQNLTSGATTYLISEPSYITTYGRLYNFYVVSDSRGVCPDGWYIPLRYVWDYLIDYLGGNNQTTIDKLVESGNAHWQGINDANNESGFTALPAGRFPLSDFSVGSAGSWWSSSTDYIGNNGISYTITNSWNYVSDYADNKNFGFSIRCLKE